jgi:hypothetical protein
MVITVKNPEGIMGEALSDLPLEESVARLRSVFEDGYGSVYLRGSLLRREPPYDDLDIIEISEESHAQSVPKTFLGTKVAYRHLTPAAWEEYLHECPRSWYMYYDLQPLHQGETEPDTVFARERAQFFDAKEPDHLAYLSYESKVPLPSAASTPTDYESLKILPGSKRSFMRGAFMLKGLHPEMRGYTTPDLLAELAIQGAVPADIPETATEIYTALSARPIHIEKLKQLAMRCSAWMTDLLVEVDREVTRKLPGTYLELLDMAISPQGASDLVEAQSNAAVLAEPHRRWVASYLLANNTALPQDAADGIKDIYGSGYSGRLIRDALAERT